MTAFNKFRQFAQTKIDEDLISDDVPRSNPDVPLLDVRFRSKKSRLDDAFGVSAYVDGERIGNVFAYASGTGGPQYTLEHCSSEVESLQNNGLAADEGYYVGAAKVVDEFKGMGIGRQLYKRLFEYITKARKRPVYVAPNDCYIRGATSREARRVWNRLAREYPSAGRVLYIEPKQKNPDVGLTASGHWGNEASGVLFVTPDRTMLLLRRSLDVLEPWTWGIPGGAIPEDEDGPELSPLDNAMKEAEEEVGPAFLKQRQKLLGSVVMEDPDSGFRYTTFVVSVWRPFDVTLNWEHDDWGWFTEEDLPELDLHPGFAEFLSSVDPWSLR